MIRGRKVDVALWSRLAGAIVGLAAVMVVELLRARPEAHDDPRVWIVVVFRWALFAFLLAFWVMDVSVHYHPIQADASYNRPAWVLGQMLLRTVVAGVVIGVLSGVLEDLVLGR